MDPPLSASGPARDAHGGNACQVVATIMAYGCNPGPETMARLTTDVTYADIQQIADWYLHEEALRAALVECTERDAPYVLDGLLYHELDLDPHEHYTDTYGYVEVNVAACPMFGKRCCPRIRGVHRQWGSSTVNRGYEHHRAITHCSACERRPRCLGGVHRGGGTCNDSSAWTVQQ